jgi:Eukaryotic aspartyl protease
MYKCMILPATSGKPHVVMMIQALIFLLTLGGVHSIASSMLAKVDVTINPSYCFKDGYMRSLRKYGIISSESLGPANHEIASREAKRHRRDANSSLPLSTSISSDGFYLTQVAIGEGEVVQTFNMDFDTGTSDFWVLSTLLPEDDGDQHNLYDPSASTSSFLLSGQTWADGFQGTTEVGGVVFSDTVNFGGIVVRNQAVQAASQAIPALINGSRDGLVGLGLGNSSIVPGSFPSVVDNLKNLPLQQPVFTCLLTRPSEPNGFYTFGYIDETLTEPGIQSNDVITNNANATGQWAVNSEYAVLNGMRIERQGNIAVVDTGTPGILLEENLVIDIYALLNGKFDNSSQTWVFPVNNTGLPMLTLPAGSADVTLTPADFAIGQPDDSGFVVGSIQTRRDLSFDVFGHPWMNNIYAIFDLGMTGPDVIRFGLVPRSL